LHEAFRYKKEGRKFPSFWSPGDFSLSYSLQPQYGPDFNSFFNRNEYQEYFLLVNMAGD